MDGFVMGRLPSDAVELGRGGWILGSFFPTVGQDSERHVEEVEVKYWTFSQGEEKSHHTKISDTTEWTMVLEGSTVAMIDGKEFELNAGDYVLLRPGTPNNLVARVPRWVTALTVKAPSDPHAKRTVAVTD